MKRWGWWVAGGVVVAGVVVVGLLALQRGTSFESLARAGKDDAKAGLHSLEAKQVPAALASFTKARDEFGRARDLLGPEWVRGVPWVGRQVQAADDLVAIGFEGSSAGVEVSELLAKATSISGDDRLGQVLGLARPHLDSALSSLVAVSVRAKELNPEGLAPQLASVVREMQDQLAPMAHLLARSQAFLDLERYLLSGQHRFIVLAQNNAQLRPTGGFPGTFGLVELGPDGFHLKKFTDIYTLPNDTLNLPVPDGRNVNARHLFFRSAGWWVDFPTSGATMVKLWDSMEPKQPAIDGIVAIDLPTIRDLLKVFGPIHVPESPVALTWKNVVEQLSYVVEIDRSGGQDETGKKNVVVSLAGAVMDRLTHLTDEEFLPAMESLASSASEKHVQFYVTDPQAQAVVVAAGGSGAIALQPTTTDLVASSNAVLRRPAKGNLGVSKSLDYQVALNPDGSADTQLSLGYAKSPVNKLGTLTDRLFNYVRVNRAPGTTLVDGVGIRSLEDATGLPTFAHYFQLGLGKTATVDLHTRLPQAVRREGDTWHYQLLLIKQADLVDTAATVTVTAPEGWKVAGSAASFRVSGTAVKITSNPGSVSVKTPLKQDLLLDVTLVKA